MPKYEKNSTKYTPEFFLDSDAGLFTVKGISIPDSPIDYYGPCLEIIQGLKATDFSTKAFNVEFYLEYQNTGSSRMLAIILNELNKLKAQGMQLLIKWYYQADDEDILINGKEMEEVTSSTFEFIPLD